MKTLPIKLIVVSIFSVASFSVSAQTGSATRSDAAVAQKQRPVINSAYFGMEKKIMEWSISGEIPATFPKRQERQTKEEYKEVMKEWGRNNLNLIKKEHHVKLTSNKATGAGK
jgi:hypothetical protein